RGRGGGGGGGGEGGGGGGEGWGGRGGRGGGAGGGGEGWGRGGVPQRDALFHLSRCRYNVARLIFVSSLISSRVYCFDIYISTARLIFSSLRLGRPICFPLPAASVIPCLVLNFTTSLWKSEMCFNT